MSSLAVLPAFLLEVKVLLIVVPFRFAPEGGLGFAFGPLPRRLKNTMGFIICPPKYCLFRYMDQTSAQPLRKKWDAHFRILREFMGGQKFRRALLAILLLKSFNTPQVRELRPCGPDAILVASDVGAEQDRPE